MPKPQPSIFISYRRDDCGASVRSLAAALVHTFGPAAVYLDTRGNQIGEDWPSRIQKALTSSTIVLVAVGPSWLKVADSDSRRRIDDPTDWVRREISTALVQNARVIPLLLQGAELPRLSALPEGLQELAARQAYAIRDDYWDRDLAGLIGDLAQLGCRRVTADIRYPRPHVTPDPLSEDELQAALGRLDGWEIVTSVIPGQEPRTRIELMKSFRFRSFEDALAFMNAAAPFIARLNHHPRWENVFSTVVVWLTTWDIGFLPSNFDIELARRLDELQSEAQAGRKKALPSVATALPST